MGSVEQKRVAIVGAGHVGATAAYTLMLRALCREIVLIDSDPTLAAAEAADLSDANALVRPARIWAGTYEDAAAAQIAVLTAGAATHGAESRLSVVSRSAAIVTSCVDQLIDAGFSGILIVAANPVDLMTLLALRRSRLAANRVIGTGSLLDTARLQQTLAIRLGVAPGSIDGLVLGEHGDSEVAAFSTVRVGGLTLDRFCATDQDLERLQIAREVREAGYRIVQGKGYTSFGISTAIVRICEAILRDEHAVLPVSTLLTGQYGITDVCLSLPCVLGAIGVERVLSPDLSAEETRGLLASATTLRAALAAAQKPPDR
ncbi:L-lactate dehydrogenase [uncultured Brevundimonas sp.]|jgi:L-lactate dehydrogenase|uniref:L-lactate dehydrogenase n=1 Tax=uncultured Brevundimonas sp. TaxID=213418 RepID=UPI0030ECB912|tara:strand:+ start:5040 stop:5990 length:951 start_codon:yes stop_codon:yes gene_type:complete